MFLPVRLGVLLILLLFCNGKSLFAQAENTETFTFCQEGRVYDYFRTQAGYTNGRKNLKQLLLDSVSPESGPRPFSGYIVVHFGINCKGEIGGFSSYGMDSSYQRLAAPEKTTESLIQRLQGLKGWNPGTYTDGSPANSRQFYIFKFKQGKLTDVLP